MPGASRAVVFAYVVTVAGCQGEALPVVQQYDLTPALGLPDGGPPQTADIAVVPPDFSTLPPPVDLARDFAVPPVIDLSVVRDLSVIPPDLSSADLAVPPDLRPPPDLYVPPDMTAPRDLAGLPRFSFFVTSLKAMQRKSGNQMGFGGDLRFGEVGPNAGLRGADKLCASIAEDSMPGSSQKGWRAFLSATNDGNGAQVNAIDRIGNGPWYDRLGRLLANNKAELLFDRPQNADVAIKQDFPNEDGVPNHQPDPGQGQVDNHDTLTGTNSQGKLYSQTGTCKDWTAAAGNKLVEGLPRVGHSWPRGIGPTANWMSSLDESGCAPGVNLIEMGPPNPNSNTVGSGGGYGGIYCFALNP